MCVPVSSDEELECCSPTRAGWCDGRIALLLMLASPDLLCNSSWFMWDVCIKIGGKKYVLGVICYPYLLHVLPLQLFLQRVYCYKILEIRLQRTLKDHLVFHLVSTGSLYLCYPWHLSDVDVFSKIPGGEDCFSRKTALCPFFLYGVLFVVFWCNILILRWDA